VKGIFYAKSAYLDFHTHKAVRASTPNIIEIVSVHLNEKVPSATPYTIGQHPWWTEIPASDFDVEMLKKELKQERCLAMGEMGLDKFKGPALPIQEAVLRRQLEIARELNLPVNIHCVRMFHQLLKLKKDFPEIKKWCIHGYSRHLTLAQQLLKEGFYLSLMPNTYEPLAYQELVKNFPPDKLFLETDSIPNIRIESIYLQVAKLRNITVDALKQQIITNAEIFFSK
jgi:TatD DNase family protein